MLQEGLGAPGLDGQQVTPPADGLKGRGDQWARGAGIFEETGAVWSHPPTQKDLETANFIAVEATRPSIGGGQQEGGTPTLQ